MSSTAPQLRDFADAEVSDAPLSQAAAAAQAEAGELHLLRSVFAALPAAVTVQDSDGRFVLANDAAAAALGMTAAADAGLEADDVRQRRQDAVALLQAGRGEVRDETFRRGHDGERVFRTAQQPVEIGGEALLVSASIDITDQKAIEKELFRRAFFDELTGLPIRSVIEGRVNQLIHGGDPSCRFALAFLDVDNFKHINDYYGHGIGDALLIEIAKRLSFTLRDTDTLSRISGDEFLMLLHPVTDRAEIDQFLEFLLQRLRAPFYIDGSELFASASIGVSLFPDHGRDFEALRQNADLAMYRVKNDTKGGAIVFDRTMESEAQERMKIEQALRLAILDKRFCCAFQPKVDIRSREVMGIEALVRLRDDNGVIQAPGAFINLAVELGLIDELTHLVVDEIMRSIDLIDERFGAGASISINVAARQATNLKFMQSLAGALEATGCPTRFIVEVTEDAFVAKSQFQTEILPLLRRIGVRISIDDFGIGYSSLSALADITADEIKIDRSFITDIHKRPRSQGILKAIESLSDALGMTVVAEGLETFEELAYLQGATRIRYAQGYYFSKPIFLDELKPASSVTRLGRPVPLGRQLEEARPRLSRFTGQR